MGFIHMNYTNIETKTVSFDDFLISFTFVGIFNNFYMIF